MRHGRFITTAVAALAAMAIGPAYAAAAPSPLTDDGIADFAAGTTGADTWAIEPGSVRLKRSDISENFDGSALPAGWTATSWTPPNGGATVAGGSLTVDGAHFNDTNPSPTLTAPRSLEFRATFGDAEFQNVGLGDTFNGGPWAMFSTGGGTLPKGLYARTLTAATGGTAADTDLVALGIDRLAPHTFRIEWSAGNVAFFVDGAPISTPTAQIAGPMRPVVSDFTFGAPAVTVDWLAMGSAPASGTFVSRVLTADDAHTVWGALTPTVAGSGVTFETRSGQTPAPDSSWSAWQAVGNGGAIQSPSGKYIQYKATLTSAAASLDKVAIDYAIDTIAPAAAIDGVQVSGTTARITFSSSASDLDHFECSVDGSAYATCVNPKELTGMAVGSHTVFVRAVDKAGNVGSAISKSFVVDAPPSGGSPSPAPGGSSSAADTTAPTVSLLTKSLRASKRGTVAVRVGCPGTETRCAITVQLKRGRGIVARKAVTVLGGKTATVTLRLTKAVRRQLSRHDSAKVTAVITATDAAGNRKTVKRAMTLRAPKA